MKIKVFRFEVSNAASSATANDRTTTWYYSKIEELQQPDEIENTINNFIKDKKVIDIKINNVDENYHNNGRGNKIKLYYTIIYEEL